VIVAVPTLERTTFRTSRLLEFCSKKELVAQTGHEPEAWPLVVLKELVDNALDACEEAGIAPEVRLKLTHSSITVTDNGPGIAPETIASILDFTTRTSSREAYVSPTRGAQGNALKTILPCRSFWTARQAGSGSSAAASGTRSRSRWTTSGRSRWSSRRSTR
jgi:DNA topoisomerase VI subunit B